MNSVVVVASNYGCVIISELLFMICVVDYGNVKYLCTIDLIVNVDILSVYVVTTLLSVMLIIISDALLLVKVKRRKVSELGSVEVQCTYDQTCEELPFALLKLLYIYFEYFVDV